MDVYMTYRVLVTTCDKAVWAMRPFAYLFNTYWSAQQPVDILCEHKPNFKMPENFRWLPFLMNGESWPKDRWTNGVIHYLNTIKEQFVVILLDDYWLNRTVDTQGIGTLMQYMSANRDVLRIDLTKDRLYAGGMRDYDVYGHYDLVSAPGSEYQMSLQAGIWNKGLLMSVLQTNQDPWQVELQGTTIVNERDMTILGTRQNLVKYANGMKNGSDDVNTDGIEKEHLDRIKRWFKNYD